MGGVRGGISAVTPDYFQAFEKQNDAKQLALKAKTTQAVISRLERMTTNVSVELLKRIAEAFGAQLRVRFD